MFYYPLVRHASFRSDNCWDSVDESLVYAWRTATLRGIPTAISMLPPHFTLPIWCFSTDSLINNSERFSAGLAVRPIRDIVETKPLEVEFPGPPTQLQARPHASCAT